MMKTPAAPTTSQNPSRASCVQFCGSPPTDAMLPSTRFDLLSGLPIAGQKKSLGASWGCVVFRFSGRNAYKSILWVNIWPKNSNFRSNLIAKIDSAGRDLFVANGKWSKSSKIINFHQFSKMFNNFLCYSSFFVVF